MTAAPRTTRKPTGKPPWPILLVAGAEKAGKSYAAALAAKSDLIGRTSWLTFGEDQPDEYGLLADFDIVEHDGSYRDFVEALRWTAEQPAPEHGAPLLVVDSMSRLWDLLGAQAQESAWKRAAANAEKKRQPIPNEDPSIGVDLWNVARQRWDRVMDLVRAFPGPVVLTARLDTVAVIGPNGSPTGAKQTKVQAHKSLPFDVGAIVELPQRGEAWLTGVRSVSVALPERLRLPDFTIDGLWRRLGLHELEVGGREHARPRVDAGLDDAEAPERPKPGPGRQQAQRPAQQQEQQRPAQREQRPAEKAPSNWDPAPWEDAIAEARTIAELRKVHADATERNVLGFPISNGDSLEAFLWKVRRNLELSAERVA